MASAVGTGPKMVLFTRSVVIDNLAGFYNNISTLCHEIQGAVRLFWEIFVVDAVLLVRWEVWKCEQLR